MFMGRDGATLALRTKAEDILDVLSHFSRQHDGRAAPFPLPTGGIGFLSYEYCRALRHDPAPGPPDPLGLPDALFLFGSVFLVFDHYTDTISLVGLNYREKEIDLERALDETERRINDLDFNFMAPARTDWRSSGSPRDDDRETYLRGVEP